MLREQEAPERLQRPPKLLRATIDISARFASASPSWQAVLGWDAPALLGDSFVVRVHPDDMELAVGAIHSALGSGAAACFRARYAHRDGTYVPLRWRVAPRLDRLLIDLTGRPLPRHSTPAIPPATSR